MAPLLDLEVALWRKTLRDGIYQDTEVQRAIRCNIVPVSRFDQVGAYSYESTHIVWVPHWLELHKEDQLRYGRRGDPESDQLLQLVYTINGRRAFTLGITHRSYYAREQE